MAEASAPALVLLQRIQANPMDYDAYVEVIPLLDKDAECKQTVREKFHTNFPLDENTWLDWLNSGASEDLYVAALNDYLSPALHVAYLRFLQHNTAATLSVEAIRSKFKSSAELCGSHYTRGHLFWDAWIQFEESVENGEVSLPYQLRACAPIENVQMYWHEFVKKFPVLSKDFEHEHQTALRTVQRQQAQEQVLREARQSNDECAGSPLTAANGKLEKEWLNYLWMEQHAGLPQRELTVLFERALGDSCLSGRLWQMYLRALEQQQQQNGSLDAVRNAASRAVRNVPSSAPCWASLLRAGANAADQYWEQTVGNVPPNELLEPALVYLKLFPERWDQVMNDVGDDEPDLLVELLLIELPRGKGNNRRRNWERVHQLRPQDESLWMAHIAEETKCGASEGRIRELFQQAVSAVKSSMRGLQVVGNAWIRFEFTANDTFQVSKAMDIVAKRKRECARGAEHQPAAAAKKRAEKPKNVKEEEEEEEKRRPAKRFKQEETKPVRSKKSEKADSMEVEGDDDGAHVNEVFIGTLPDSATKETLRAYFSYHVHVEGAFVQMVSVNARRDNTKFAHVTFGGVTEQDAVLAAHEACKLSGKEMDGMPLQILLSKPPSKQKPSKLDAEPAPVKKKPAATAFLPRALAKKKD